jgi:hypothetical protein
MMLGTEAPVKRPRTQLEIRKALLASRKFLGWHRPIGKAVKYHDSESAKSLAVERHYSPAEVAKIWGISADLARDIFRGEAGVLAIDRTGSKKYVTLRIPGICTGSRS